MPAIRFLFAVTALLSFAGPTVVTAQERPGRPANCLLVVDGQQLITGRCLFTPIGKDGSFQIQSGNGKFFAMVLIESKGVGEGHWNEEPYAHTPLGTLYREEGCWVNGSASVCAY